ncbi:FadR/GntR family transcriptional regulator [Mycobacterium sp. E1747]|uniref:FadR/GntR family transcriptional regulator n=1 Tax=Mycobacterium sp. E1747 TaxID=1834128 RepID=UPI0007FE53C6|nr:GntR family transcriptional regulator [Mycobacterium sp. E1747]OBH12781.1 GntR family transcriptional regulator [Mycobacterium sp. E1747]
MTRQASLTTVTIPESPLGAVRAPKASEIVSRALRRMIVDGQLKDGDYLPYEAELMAHFKVSRPTLREAIRVLESERLVEIRRGSRTGARVCVPGPEIVARPASLVLELSGATLADVMNARMGIEPLSARYLAESATQRVRKELRSMVNAIPVARENGDFASATAKFHLRMVELSGNATLAMIAGMLHEITERHTRSAILVQKNVVPDAAYNKMFRSYTHLADLVDDRAGDKAEAHWRRHMQNAAAELLRGHERTMVRDIMD